MFARKTTLRVAYRCYSARKVVVVSGCDSGLGYSLAQRCLKKGVKVVAGCLNEKGEGAKALRDLGGEVLSLDVTDTNSIQHLLQTVEAKKMEVQAVVNNAGVMVFGEFEWQTSKQIQRQVQVNLLGSINFAHAFMPLLRRDRGRLINVVSHCSMVGLPGLSIYSATKAGILMWNDALRIEQSKYGIRVISFVPGSFYGHSGIMAEQSKHAEEMLKEMKEESTMFHMNYFKTVQAYLSHLPRPTSPSVIPDKGLLSKFEEAVLSDNPRSHYKHEPPRYTIYHFLFKISPLPIRDYLVRKFVSLPAWKGSE